MQCGPFYIQPSSSGLQGKDVLTPSFSSILETVPKIFPVQTLELEIRPHGHINGSTAGGVPISYSVVHTVACSGSIKYTIFYPQMPRDINEMLAL